jgi:Carbohydrate esterase, sialic acid-specific acetylesterase
MGILKFKSSILVILALLNLSSCTSQKEGKHLFILSGQSNMAGLKPEESFTPAIESEFGIDNIIVVKDAVGGQPIHRWYKDWKSPNDSTLAKPDLYDSLMSKVYTAIENEEIQTITFIWMQGERDAREEWGEVYEQSLKGLYDQLSSDLNRDDINYVIGRLNDFDLENSRYAHWQKVRQAQVDVANSDPRFARVNTDDLNDGFNRAGKEISNDLHMSAEGYVILGQRFADKSIELIKNK